MFDGLDKITGRIISFEVAINETVQFGALQITPRVCYSRPPTDPPQTDAFAQVDEIDEQKKVKRVFSGWMFADSPGLNGIEHPIFDIWLTACKGGTVVIHDAPAAEASAPNPDESPPTDPAADAASPEQPAPPPVQAAKKKKPKPPTVVAAPAPDTQPATPLSQRPIRHRLAATRAGADLGCSASVVDAVLARRARGGRTCRTISQQNAEG